MQYNLISDIYIYFFYESSLLSFFLNLFLQRETSIVVNCKSFDINVIVFPLSLEIIISRNVNFIILDLLYQLTVCCDN